MLFLALLQILEKSWMKEILVVFLCFCFFGGFFFDSQILFDTIEHVVFLWKLEYYYMHGLSNESFKFNLSNRKQYVLINSYNSNLAPVEFDQGSGLSPLLFLVYINDLTKQ